MATIKNKPATVEVKAAQAAESKYFIRELVDQNKMFNASKELVYVALTLSGKDDFTVNEAQTIIEAYKNKEVK